MAQYTSHNNETLCYIEYILYRINQIKGAFKNACQTDAII